MDVLTIGEKCDPIGLHPALGGRTGELEQLRDRYAKIDPLRSPPLLVVGYPTQPQRSSVGPFLESISSGRPRVESAGAAERPHLWLNSSSSGGDR